MSLPFPFLKIYICLARPLLHFQFLSSVLAAFLLRAGALGWPQPAITGVVQLNAPCPGRHPRHTSAHFRGEAVGGPFLVAFAASKSPLPPGRLFSPGFSDQRLPVC